MTQLLQRLSQDRPSDGIIFDRENFHTPTRAAFRRIRNRQKSPRLRV
jgi:hypothetical protein